MAKSVSSRFSERWCLKTHKAESDEETTNPEQRAPKYKHTRTHAQKCRCFYLLIIQYTQVFNYHVYNETVWLLMSQ